MSDSIPVVMTTAGRQNQPPAALNAALIEIVASVNPGYTANLPGSLIEDISSTDTYALVTCDQAVTELINSITPYGANNFLLNQLGQIYGVPLGQGSTTSVYVVVTGPPGFVVPVGFTISDGTYQYVVQDGGIIGSAVYPATTGVSAPLYALSTTQGSWAVLPNTVTQIASSVQSSIAALLSVTNPTSGVPGTSAQTPDQYRVQVLAAGLAVSTGMATTLKTALRNVSGVQGNLISVQAQSGGWKIIVGGGDPYQVAGAIYASVLDISTLVGSVLNVINITNANPGKVTTNLNHGYATGQVVQLSGVVGMAEVNNVNLTATVVDEKNFTIGINTTSVGSYVSGGVVSPNLRNITVPVYDAPDLYEIIFVNPPQQTVAMTITWNTTSTNIISPAAVAAAAQPSIAAYVNGLAPGQPMNLFELQATFQTAVAALVPTALLTRLLFAVSINGVATSPEAGTGIIAGDPESYFYTSPASINVTQG